MQAQDFLISAQDLRVGAAPPWRPLALLDLDACPADARIAPPPFPLIGLGDARHPIAPVLDAVLEAPIPIDAIIRQVLAAPNAAAAAMHLLRCLDGLEPQRALALESMCYAMLQGSAEQAAWLSSRAPAPALAPGALRIERNASVLRLTFDRPHARNAIDRVMRDQLGEALSLAELDSDINTVELRGVGPAFCIGGDLAEFGATRDPATAHLIRAQTLPAPALARLRQRLDVHVQGPCIGAGLEMAAFAARLTAAPDAWFQLPELAMGLIPGAGGCVSIPRRIGRARAALMLLSARRISAHTALAWGLIDAIEERI